MKRLIEIGLVLSVVLIFTTGEAFAQGRGGQQSYSPQGTKGQCGGCQYGYSSQAGFMRQQMMQHRYRGAMQQQLRNGSGAGQTYFGSRGGGMGQGRMQGRQGSSRMGAGQSDYGNRGGGMGQGRMQGRQGSGRSGGGQNSNSAETDGFLSQQEIESILLMREEEKLARDVYLALGEQWNVPVFSNIARSESRHMDTFKSLIKKYGQQDPVVDDTPGVFANPKLARLYSDFVRDGLASLADAYKVGVRIEELDIADLQEGLNNVTHSDLQRVYKNLLRASQNHLKSFTSER